MQLYIGFKQSCRSEPESWRGQGVEVERKVGGRFIIGPDSVCVVRWGLGSFR